MLRSSLRLIVTTLVEIEGRSQAGLAGLEKLSVNHEILKDLPLAYQREGDKSSQSLRPVSPVKMLSNFLGSVSLGNPSTPLRNRHNSTVSKDLPSLPPPLASNLRPDPDKISNERPKSSGLASSGPEGRDYRNPLALLEESLNTYIVALRSRSGNIVGRVLRSRATLDETTVNELYNIILQDPGQIQAAAVVSVDVLFAAFEKFLQRAWRERMGLLLHADVLSDMQSCLDAGKPVMFAQQVQRSVDEMPPQNRRAFAATIKLLSDLLDASGNDGDRGALMASFAEVLFPVPNPHKYIMLLDRLVDDCESLFGEVLSTMDENISKPDTNSLKRTRSGNTGSVNSNTSSFRKKFGFGTITRENSRNESESKVASIWRTLSKTSKDPNDSHSQPSSISKGSGPSLIRSRSTDADPRMLPPARPISRDRPTSSGSTAQEEGRSRPPSSHMNMPTLSSIGENTPTKPTILTKKKRRSSLSDLRSPQPSELTAAWPNSPSQKTSGGLDNGPTQTKPQASPRQGRVAHCNGKSWSTEPRHSAERFVSPQRLDKVVYGENRPPKTSPERPLVAPVAEGTAKGRHEDIVISTFSPQKQQVSKSGIPSPRGNLTERAWPPNSKDILPGGSVSSSRKLRLQSPQKLRERLNQEQKILTISDESFQAELTKIGDEISKYKIQRSPTKGPTSADRVLFPNRIDPVDSTLQALCSRLTSLQASLSKSTADQSTSFSRISSDIDSSLTISDQKARKLDELYREANAENEALYDRFNDELGKILGRVKKGEGVETLKSKLKDNQEEVTRLRKENSRLKREAVGLRSMLRDEP